MRELFVQAGFESVEIRPYYKATDYFAFFVPAYIVVVLIENLFERLG